ncbi:Gfo/Idh/MocA family oxidoreductase [Butyrivibrio sp. AC2005]|uniref:Gfo/Idh/MocA family oxidoreductase n=1 Tax=Butyrivibrio sp. AC2005 TaxID=1280672 RepID=UPI0003FAB974|nr:Gfo/Idh/MocA family oxidoreductase [Butyrivibrio sp. AC2005]
MKKIITYGSFDLFHEGHYRILERAKALGDYLIVGVTTEYYDRQRGKLNLVDPIMTRIQNVKDTGFADEIIVEDHVGQKIEDVQKYGIDTFVLGSDWTGKFDYLKQYCNVVYLERTPNISSTIIREDRVKLIKLGIVGTGRIARRFFAELKYVSGIEAIAAYNPDTESLKRFKKDFPILAYSNDYVKFLDKVDAVYVASPNETHAAYVRQAIMAGKHVICEKPMTFTYDEAVELYALAKEHQVVLMEGIRAAYLPGFQQLLSVARNGTIGEICDVEACFTRLGDPKSREMADAKYGGAFMEYGSYTMLPIFKLFGTEYVQFSIDSILGKDGIDKFTKVQFRYKDGLATSKTGAGVKSEGQLVISGTKGYILAKSPWWLIKEFDVRFEDPNKVEHYDAPFVGSDGFRYEIAEFLGKVNGTGGNDYKLTSQESIAMAKVVEKFMGLRRTQQGW